MSASIVRSARSTACFQPNIHKCTAVAGSTEVSTAVSTAVHSSHWQRAHAAPENHVWNHIRRKKESECPASSPCHVPPLLCSGPVVVRDDDSHSETCAKDHAGSLAAGRQDLSTAAVNNLAKPVGWISQLGQDALAQTTAAGAGATRLSPVRNDIAGILRRMQPRCERERDSLPRRTSPGCQ